MAKPLYLLTLKLITSKALSFVLKNAAQELGSQIRFDNKMIKRRHYDTGVTFGSIKIFIICDCIRIDTENLRIKYQFNFTHV